MSSSDQMTTWGGPERNQKLCVGGKNHLAAPVNTVITVKDPPRNVYDETVNYVLVRSGGTRRDDVDSGGRHQTSYNDRHFHLLHK